jgi:hypothetical protein
MGIILWPNVNVSQDSALGQELLRAGTLEQLQRCVLDIIDIEDWIIHERDSRDYNRLRPETLLAELMCTCSFFSLVAVSLCVCIFRYLYGMWLHGCDGMYLVVCVVCVVSMYVATCFIPQLKHSTHVGFAVSENKRVLLIGPYPGARGGYEPFQSPCIHSGVHLRWRALHRRH